MRVNAITFANMMQAIATHALTLREIADVSGLHYVTVMDYVRALHRRRVVYIAEWRRNSRGFYIAAFQVNPGAFYMDATKPPPLTQAQRQERYRERNGKRAKNPWSGLEVGP